MEIRGEEVFEEEHGKHLNLQCKQCTREQEPKVEWRNGSQPECAEIHHQWQGRERSESC